MSIFNDGQCHTFECGNPKPKGFAFCILCKLYGARVGQATPYKLLKMLGAERDVQASPSSQKECRTFGCVTKSVNAYCERCLKFGADKRMPRQKQVELDRQLVTEKHQRISQDKVQYDFENNAPAPYSWA